MTEEARVIPDNIYDVTISSSNPSSSIEPTLSNSIGLSSFNYSSENSDMNNRVGSRHLRPIRRQNDSSALIEKSGSTP